MTDYRTTVEQLRQFILNHALPKTDIALFGITCPYCGKSDRIRQLEGPEEIRSRIESADADEYVRLWKDLGMTDSLSAIGAR